MSVNLFISYKTDDRDLFKIPQLKQYLENLNEIRTAFFWETDVEADIYAYMEDKIEKSDIMIVFCSTNYLKSKPCKKEYQIADRLEKQIIPVFISEKHIPTLLINQVGVEIDIFADFTENAEKIANEVVRRVELLEKNREEQSSRVRDADAGTDNLAQSTNQQGSSLDKPDLFKKSQMHIALGENELKHDNYDNALAEYNEALDIARNELFDPELVISLQKIIKEVNLEKKGADYVNRGRTLHEKGEYKSAREAFSAARDIFDKTKQVQKFNAAREMIDRCSEKLDNVLPAVHDQAEIEDMLISLKKKIRSIRNLRDFVERKYKAGKLNEDRYEKQIDKLQRDEEKARAEISVLESEVGT